MATVPRFHVHAALAVGSAVDLPRSVAHHAAHVLRLRPGDPVVLFDGRGGEYRGRLSEAGRVDITEHDPLDRASPLAVTLVQCWIASDKLDWVVEKAVELGAGRILFAPGRRSVVRLDGERRQKRVERLREIAVAACCQCGLNRIPALAACDTLEAALSAGTADGAAGVLLLPGASRSLLDTAPTAHAFALAIGPEGGFDESELELAARAGYEPARLGPRVLRTETAGLAALAALQARAGDWR